MRAGASLGGYVPAHSATQFARQSTYPSQSCSQLRWRVKSLNWIHPRRLSFAPERELRVRDDLFWSGGFERRGFDLREIPWKWIQFIFMRCYDQVRRAVTYLRWNDADADEIAPSLYAGRRRSGTDNKKEEPVPVVVTPAPNAGAPVEPNGPPVAPAAPAVLTGGPFVD